MTQSISNITFTYIKKEGLCNESNRLLLKDIDAKIKTSHNFNNMVLPSSMNPAEYGIISGVSKMDEGGVLFHRYHIINGPRVYKIDEYEMSNIVTILGNINLSWVDTKVSEKINLFKREIKKSTIYFLDGEIILRKQILPAKPYSRLQKDKSVIKNFFTLDIETINKDSKKVPYLISAYGPSVTGGNDYITSFAEPKNGLINQKSLFTNFFDQLLQNLPVGKTYIYAHNLSGFDGIFMLRYLLDYGKVEPLLFNNKLMSIKLTIGSKDSKKVIQFKDSFLLLPLSLRKLCAAFNIILPKGYFPFLLNDILYRGILPKFEYWTKIPLSEFENLVNQYTGKVWSFKDEAIKYCQLDCKTLHEIITSFNKLIFDHFNVDSHKALTLPALSLRIYKTHFMPKNTIYQLLGKPEINIRDSYTGGAVDVYIPHNNLSGFFTMIKAFFKKLYIYDVNSLYPYIMAEYDMPIGKPVAFEGNIRKCDPKAYGFFYCKITSPKYLENPILQRRIKTSEGIRTIAGLGSWEGWIFSTEMDNAMKFGYTFEIIKGYEFERGEIFRGYIESMYNLRLQYERGEAMNLIAKLLMNSLYGKFGMKLESTEVQMYDQSNEAGKESLKEDLELYGESVQDFIKIGNKLLIIRNIHLSYKYNEELDMYHGLDVNIAIASAITSGARVHMSFLKNNPLFKLYYTDTDSAVIDAALPDELVGNKLGQMKLEHVVDKAVFLAPKVYGLIDVEGKEIIKVKGVNSEIAKNELSFYNLQLLLIKDTTREFNQEKWFKKVIEGDIDLKQIVYTLKITSNKRAPIPVQNLGNNPVIKYIC